MSHQVDWNELVPPGRRFASPNFNARKPAGLKPTHIVIHVTGTDSLASVKQTFMAKNSVSAHYLVGKDGALLQFVPDGSRAWPEYDFFFQRWPGLKSPVNFDLDPDPNNYAIGIETLGVGGKIGDPKAYTPAMCGALRALIFDLSKKYAIPMEKGRVIGHEDVNPIGRFGRDPCAGFDWTKVYT